MGGRFTDRVVVVTGGARGIGHAIAARVAGDGAIVVVPDLLDPDEPLAGARYVRCDITVR